MTEFALPLLNASFPGVLLKGANTYFSPKSSHSDNDTPAYHGSGSSKNPQLVGRPPSIQKKRNTNTFNKCSIRGDPSWLRTWPMCLVLGEWNDDCVRISYPEAVKYLEAANMRWSWPGEFLPKTTKRRNGNQAVWCAGMFACQPVRGTLKDRQQCSSCASSF